MAARDLRTVLFTDIVGSTEQAARLGDRAWGALLARHHALVRAALRATGGREMDTAGDGFFATFARPTDALACARAIVAGVGGLGLAVRVGLHAGEVETRAGKAEGITVHEAARLMAAAAPDEVLVSATVHELVAGAGWKFTDRGPLVLKGLAEPVHAYALDLAAAAPIAATGRVGLGTTLRDHPAGRWAVGAGVAVVLLAAVLIGVTLAGGGAPPSATPTALAGASVTANASPTGSPFASTLGDCEPLCYTPLVPGRYTLDGFSGAPTLTIADAGWEVFQWATIERVTSPGDRLWILLVGNLPAPADVCNLQDNASIGPNPVRWFLDWAHANKALQVSAGVARQLGDLAATQFDVSVVDKYACQQMAPHAVSLGQLGPQLNVGDGLRLEVSSRDGQLILIIIAAPSAAELATFEPLAEQVLSTWTYPP
jgi:class 3 adenylate cyclase